MADQLTDAAAYLASVRSEYAAEDVTVTRGNTGALQQTLKATRGRTVFEIEHGDGTIGRIETLDWLVKAEDYDFGQGVTEPLRGDRIMTAAGDEYEVAAPTGVDHVFRYTDAYRQSLRIHTIAI